VTPEYDANGRLERLSYDRDRDGTVETWGYMDGAKVVRVEVDENHDGKVDRWEYHKAGEGESTTPGATPGLGTDRTVERIDRATRFDGKVSRREFFSEGLLTRVEEDTDGNGAIDAWSAYEGGALVLMSLDTTGRGTPDRRLVYRGDGTFDHVEVDATVSGTFSEVAP
jgi:hypothetical protein